MAHEPAADDIAQALMSQVKTNLGYNQVGAVKFKPTHCFLFVSRALELASARGTLRRLLRLFLARVWRPPFDNCHALPVLLGPSGI